MAKQHFFLGKEYLGSRTIPSYREVPGLEVRWHHSYALYCLRCGDIWARFMHESAPLTQLTCRPCLKHGEGNLANLHYFEGDPHNYDDDWPDKAIEYEFNALMAQATKEQP